MVCRAYKTTSTEALQVIAGQMPIDLELQRRVAYYNASRGMSFRLGESIITIGNQGLHETLRQIDNFLMQSWQDRWTKSNKGRTTYKFFPDIRKRLTLTWFRPDFYTSQMLTGHGAFNSRLHAFNLKPSPLCSCGEEDTVEHVILDCTNNAAARVKLIAAHSYVNWPPASFQDLLKDEESFKKFQEFSKASLNNKL